MGDESGNRWSAQTDQALRKSGWYPGRSVPTEEWEITLGEHGFQMHEAARRFLSEFGGLVVERREEAKELGRSPFELDPNVAKWDSEIFEFLSEEAGASLYPIGATDRRNFYLGIAPDGAVYLGMDHLERVAETPEEALERLVEVR